MTDWVCAACRAQVAPGAPRCPECPSTDFDKPEEAGMVLKIARDGGVSDSADVRAPQTQDDGPSADTAAQAEDVQLVNSTQERHPGDEVSLLTDDEREPEADPEPEPVVPPRPPRRTPPPVA